LTNGYSIPLTTDEAFWPDSPQASAAGAPPMHVMEGLKGEDARDVAVYDLKERRLTDEEIKRRTIDFMKRSVASRKPFYAYVPYTLVHFPTLPNPKFAGKSRLWRLSGLSRRDGRSRWRSARCGRLSRRS
jgi:hypothetical protein